MKEKAIALIDANKSYCKCCGKTTYRAIAFYGPNGEITEVPVCRNCLIYMIMMLKNLDLKRIYNYERKLYRSFLE